MPKTKGSLIMKIFIDRQRQHWLQGDGGEPKNEHKNLLESW
jgi:hypothetical protein